MNQALIAWSFKSFSLIIDKIFAGANDRKVKCEFLEDVKKELRVLMLSARFRLLVMVAIVGPLRGLNANPLAVANSAEEVDQTIFIDLSR